MLEEDTQHKIDNITATEGENFKEYETYQQWLSKTTKTRNQSEERELPTKKEPKEREDEHHQGYPAHYHYGGDKFR